MVNRRCECGRAVPSFGLPGEPRWWCARCPSKPQRAVLVHKKRKSSANTTSRPPGRARQAPSNAQPPALPSAAMATERAEEASLVGRSVLRLFQDPAAPPHAPPRPYFGKVTAVRAGVRRHGTVWHVVYDDDDEEDLSRGELEEALLAAVDLKEEDGPLEVKRVKREPQGGAVGAGG